MTNFKIVDDLCHFRCNLQIEKKNITFDNVKKHLILLFLSIVGSTIFVHAQDFDDRPDFIAQKSFAIKFAPRILSPRVTFEQKINPKLSYVVELKAHAYWSPQSIRLEGGFRRYFKGEILTGPYFQAYVSGGYFSYNIIDVDTYGMQFGGGVLAGKQYNVGKKKALIDVFGGFQLIAPFYLNVESNNNSLTPISVRQRTFTGSHYLQTAFPVVLGVRFGFFGTKMVPVIYKEVSGSF